MASRLTPWIENTVATELRCADLWLQGKRKNKTLGIKSEPYTGIYEDNGSGLEIIVQLGLGSEDENRVQIVQIVAPLVLSDGETSVEARLSSACQHDLDARYGIHITTSALHCQLVLRCYTISHTTFGPPCRQLYLILDAIDWQGATEHRPQTPPTPLHSQPQVHESLRRLQATRANENLKYGAAEPQPDDMAGDMHTGGGESMADTTFESQAAFGTQMGQPIRTGIEKRKQPVEPRSEKPLPTVGGLLSLLNRTSGGQNPAPSHAPASNGGLGSRKTASDQPSAGNGLANTFSPVRLEGMNPTQPNISKDAPSVSRHGVPVARDRPKPANSSADCDWMRAYTYQCKQAHCPPDQTALLSKPESWQHPEPGNRFPDGNIPIALFMVLGDRDVNMAEEKAKEESDNDQDVDHEVNFQNDDEDELPTSSPITWPRSATPEPPKLFAISDSVLLPPDSSFAPSMANRIGAQPPSSPPIVEDNNDSDEDMETYVPQGLGEDNDAAVQPSKDAGIVHRPSTSAVLQEAAVQVKETPYVRGKNGQHNAGTPRQQNSSGTSKDMSSTSIIYGTYKEPTASMQVDGDAEKTEDGNMTIGEEAATENVAMTDAPLERETTLVSSLPSPTGPNAPATSTQEPRPVQIGLVETTPASAQPPVMKRKMDESPSRQIGQRRPKRRELKIVKHGETCPPRDRSMSPVYQQIRKDRMEEIRLARPASTASMQPPRTSSIPADDVFQHSSPRQKFGALPEQTTYHAPAYQLPAKDVNARKAPLELPAHTTTTTSSPLRSMKAADTPATTNDTKAGADAHNVEMVDAPLTVFDTFKATYPQYTGNRKHFTVLLKQIHELEMEDKMVAKYQWDDYIIRNRLDYKEYADECMDEGNGVEPYIRFYKDKLDDIMYQKGVIKNKATLLTALEELGETLQPVRQSVQHKSSRLVAKPEARTDRKSQWSTPTRDDQASASSPQYLQNAIRQRSSTHQSPSTREASREAAPLTGNPFRDFIFSSERVLSHTGDSSDQKKKQRSDP
ncbi:hypothetical protein P154DRAFT_575760 [Amniculicola lignicola CBS 123094]|uniref:Telomere replication protein EST3 n=1 Tax=Amniculicola lignicola CBS 123094 TaxID=1392246 RepID=A0A6A5WI57_9PLEO|nr:hypothetical protein P154DRAFT_575760 [Amniculicola lignicola CBS 123094]